MFTETHIVSAARDRTGIVARDAVGSEWVSDSAIKAEIRENVLECCKAFGSSTSSKEIDFITVLATVISDPQPPSVSPSGTGGTLAAGDYTYAVSVLCGTRETLMSGLTPVTTTGSTSSAVVSWPAVANATGYRVYGRISGYAQLLATLPVTATTWTDVGTALPASGPQIRNSTGGWIQDYLIDLFVGADVLTITEVIRSDAFRSEAFLEPSYDVDPLTGLRGRRGGFVDQGFQEDAFEVMQAQARWRETQKYSWAIVNISGSRYLRLMPEPERQVLVRCTYTSQAGAISSLPEEARSAVENAACRAILDCVLNRTKADPAFIGEGTLERRAFIDAITKQRDRYETRYARCLALAR